MNRREALSSLTVLFGTTIIGAEAFLSGCSNKGSSVASDFISDDQVFLLNEIGEVIIPATETSPGAQAANVGLFMRDMVRDCYSGEEQKIFLDGLEQINSDANKQFEGDFIELNIENKTALLMYYENDASVQSNMKHFYKMYKQLTVWGYFTSEPGATQALNYVAVPGRYEACIPLKPDQKAWANP